MRIKIIYLFANSITTTLISKPHMEVANSFIYVSSKLVKINIDVMKIF